MDNRRDFIKKAALLTGTASLASALPSSIARAMSINAPEGSTYLDAEHVVILMQENRSFDHVFGTLRGVRGYNDPRAIQLADKNPVWLQTNAGGQTYAPFHLDIKNTKATWMHSLPHSWANQVNARNDGRHDKWLDEKRSGDKDYRNMPLTLGYHNRNDVPFYYALADAFTVCDQHFCSSLTGTNPNRLYFWTGTIRDHKDENSRALVWNEDMDYGTLNWPTFPERLEDAGIDWRCYQNEISIDTGLEGEEDSWLSNFQDNDLEFFGQYNIQLHPRHVAQLNKRQAALNTEITALQKQAETDNGLALKKKLEQRQKDLKSVEKQLDVINSRKFEDLTAREQSLHKRAFTVNYADPEFGKLTDLEYDDNGTKRSMKAPKGDVLYQFREDVKNGKLPTVSWLTAPENFSDHPSAPWYGAWYVSEVLDILTQNPEIWKKTIFILTYDENDGYFDHVPPFTPPHSHKPGTGKVSEGIDTRPDYVTLEQEQARQDFPIHYDRECSIGLGYRVPMVIASPWSKGGWVNSEVFDHTSTLQFLEGFLSRKIGKKVFEPNISDWRRTVCGDLTSTFRPYEAKQSALPAFLKRDNFLEGIHKAKFKDVPANFKSLTAQDVEQIKQDPHQAGLLPQQEKGIKQANALPYQIYADGKLNADKTAFELIMNTATEVWGSKTIGTPFIVYAPDQYKSLKADGYETLRNWTYAVKPGDTLNDAWPVNEFETGNYHLRLYGPNGFYREFKGNHTDPEIETRLEYQRNRLNKKVLTGNVVLNIKNLSKGQHALTLTDNSYKTGAIKEIVLPAKLESAIIVDLTKSMGWYDFTLKVSGANSFEKRFAGRVETGKAGYTDPFMGRVV